MTVPTWSRSPLPQHEREQIKSLAAAGLKQSEICRRLQRSQNTVRRILREAGLIRPAIKRSPAAGKPKLTLVEPTVPDEATTQSILSNMRSTYLTYCQTRDILLNNGVNLDTGEITLTLTLKAA